MSFPRLKQKTSTDVIFLPENVMRVQNWFNETDEVFSTLTKLFTHPSRTILIVLFYFYFCRSGPREKFVTSWTMLCSSTKAHTINFSRKYHNTNWLHHRLWAKGWRFVDRWQGERWSSSNRKDSSSKSSNIMPNSFTPVRQRVTIPQRKATHHVHIGLIKKKL